MKKALLIASVLFISVISTACINNIAVQELNNKAMAYMEKGDYDTAVSRLQSCVDLDPTLYETYYNLGIAATKAKKYDIAIEAFENGIKIKPDFADFYYSIAIAQADYYDELTENIEENKQLSEENKLKAESLKVSAIENAQKYLEINPEAKDKEDVLELIQDLNKETKKEQTKVLEV